MTLTMPLGRVVLPSALNAQQNGKVDPALLTWVEPAHTALVWLMAELPARAMRAWHAEALKSGIVLTSTGRGRTPLAGRPTKVWAGVTYWQKPNTAMAAVPGTSNHGWWCADDLAEVVNGSLVGLRSSTVQWLYATGATFGFTWETTSEVWHVDWACGDVLPQAVLDFEAPTPAPAPNPQPQPQPSLETDMFLIKQDNDPSVWLVITGPKGRLRVHVQADQWDQLNADYGPLAAVADAAAFGRIVG
jgi:hypothetical protein